MINLDFSPFATTLDGQNLKQDGVEFSYSVVIANALLMKSGGNPIKLYDLASKIYKDGKIEIDESDCALIRETIDQTQGVNNLIKGPILKIIDNALRSASDQ